MEVGKLSKNDLLQMYKKMYTIRKFGGNYC